MVQHIIPVTGKVLLGEKRATRQGIPAIFTQSTKEHKPSGINPKNERIHATTEDPLAS
jgi:hypothetical protein